MRRSSIVDDLLSSSFCLRDWKIVTLTTYVTSLMPWFYLSTGWRSSSPRMQRKTGYTPLFNARRMDGHQTRQIIMCGVPCRKPITSRISQAGQVSHQRSRSFKQDWRWSGITFLRNLWHGLSCKHACSRLADTLNIHCDWLYVNVPSNRFSISFLENLMPWGWKCSF